MTQTASASSAPANTPSIKTSRLLVVDDDRDLRDLISDFLGQHGFEIHTASGAREMDRVLMRGDIDLVVLDFMMPGEDGLSICRRLNAAKGPPVIMLSARAEEVDRIVGLELGADDYLAKPFHPRELLARIRAVLRRGEQGPRNDGASPITHFFGWQLDNIKRILIRPDGVQVALSNAEFELLRVFLDRPGRALSRDQILDFLHGPNSESFDRAIDVQISRLRRKLNDDTQDEIIRTIRGIGYMFRPLK
ncbi:response regulator [Asticcacaulis machinosus]|uniref:Response regulator n=1 Tax=Asticcacaulis machinosus TaxID=2984211 RepID=A0ABT5HHX2_9CAUL|nr:response regulator [Asticcacaulis machinosus]MDC7675731.1 response regulator [Asticcacaulis machinosus]